MGMAPIRGFPLLRDSYITMASMGRGQGLATCYPVPVVAKPAVNCLCRHKEIVVM